MVRFLATPQDVKADNRVDKAGVYHLAVTGTYEGRDSNELKLSVVDGEDESQHGKTLKDTFWAPSGTPDQVVNANKKLTQLAIATNVIHPSQASQGEIDFEWRELKGCHFVAEVCINNKGYPAIKYDRIYHIDDPKVGGVPKFEAIYEDHNYKTTRLKPSDFLSGAAAEIAKDREDAF